MCNETRLYTSHIMRHYTYSAQQAADPRTQDDQPISTAIARCCGALPRIYLEYSLAQGAADDISNSSSKGNNREDDGCVGGRVDPSDLVSYPRPCRRVTACKQTVCDRKDEQCGQGCRKSPEEEYSQCTADSRDGNAGDSMVSIRQMAHSNTPENRRQIQKRDGQRGEKIRGADATGISRQINSGQEEPQCLHDVAELVDAKYPAGKEAEVQTLIVDCFSDRKPGFVKVDKRCSENEHHHGDDPKSRFESVAIQ